MTGVIKEFVLEQKRKTEENSILCGPMRVCVCVFLLSVNLCFSLQRE